MPDLSTVFNTSGFIPHGHCYPWQPTLVWLHVVSDTLIAFASYAIPVALVAFAEQRADLPFKGVFWLFGAFLVACGTTDLLDVWTLWHPTYWVSGGVKALTALLSLATAVTLFRLLPAAMALPSRAQLEAANARLQAAVAAHERTEVDLRARKAQLRAAQRIARLGHWEYDVLTQAVTWSEELFRLFGLPPLPEPPHAAGLQWYEPESRAQLDQAVQAALTDGTPYALELQYTTPDGTTRWLLARGEAVRDAAGHVVKLLGTALDLTDRQQYEQQRLLSAIALRIHQAQTLQTILDNSVAAVQQFLGADRVVVYQFAPDMHGQVVAEAVQPGWTPSLHIQIEDTCFRETLGGDYQRGKTRAISNIQDAGLTDCHRAMLERFQVQANLVVPLLLTTQQTDQSIAETAATSPRLWGLLVIHQCATTRQWQPSETALLEQVAVHMGIALQEAELSHHLQQLNQTLEVRVQQRTEALQQQLRFESLLKQITDQVRDSLDEAQILQAAVTALGQGLTVDGCNIGLYDLAAWQFTVAYEYVTALPSFLGKAGSLGYPPGIHDQLLAGQTPQFCWYGRDALRDLVCTHAILACPLQDERGLFGDLWLFRAHGEAFSEPEVRLVQQVANQCAIALRQARLYADSQQQLRFESLLKQITDQVRDSLDEAQILQAAVTALGQGLAVDSCDTGLYDLEARQFTVGYEYAPALPSVVGQAASLDYLPGIRQQLLAGQTLQFCWYGRDALRDLDCMHAILACPLQDERGVFGDLWLFRAHGEAFSETEVRLVQQVANQCAIALRQARLYADSQQQLQVLEQLNRLKDDFLGTVSHELRSPLTSIKFTLHLLERHLEQRQTTLLETEPTLAMEADAAKVSRYLRLLQTECDREVRLVNDLLEMQRLEAGVVTAEWSTVNVLAWLSELVPVYEARAQSRQQTLQVQVPVSLPTLRSDVSLLTSVLRELLTNACKYTPPGGVLGVQASATETSLQLFVTNTGAAIPPEELPRLFEKFYRSPNRDQWQQGGTGLGLALAKGQVERLGGTLSVTSDDALTVFCVMLPLEP